MPKSLKIFFRCCIFFTYFFSYSIYCNAQEVRCGTAYKEPSQNYLNKYLAEKKKEINQTEELVYIIPVVVHIIHNGEDIGTGLNLSQNQIESQIRILNEDYRRKSGTNGFNTNSVGADCNIEFRLANISPSGQTTSGVNRLKGTKTIWTINDEAQLKALIYWNSENYLNVWVTDIQGYLGYSTFPESTLNGLTTDSKSAFLDGVVIDYQYFGDIGNVKPPFNYGRTATHEIGHFLGLFHPWGSVEGCTGTDYCDDTPPAQGPNQGCPSTARAVCDFNRPEMFQNYLDYTNDICMNVFTNDQKFRMRTVLENSPRRATLLNSNGYVAPPSLLLDVGIERIVSLQKDPCSSDLNPVVVIRNYGLNTITKFTINYGLSNDKQSYIWNGSLESNGTINISLPIIQSKFGENLFFVTTSSPNDQTDLNVVNDEKTQSITLKKIFNLPFKDNFNQSVVFDSLFWTIQNLDKSKTWIIQNLQDPTHLQSATVNLYNYANNLAQDYLILSPFDFQSSSEVELTFDVSYALFQKTASIDDILKVMISTNCGGSFDTIIYQKGGRDLATAPSVNKEWEPRNNTDWRKEKISLNYWVGKPYVQIAFVSVNGFGNNIFLDNISLSTKENNTQNTVKIYPNPVQNDLFYVDMDLLQNQEVSFRLFDLMGKVLMEKKISNVYKDLLNVKIDDTYFKGVAILEISGQYFKMVKKIVIE